MVGGIWLDKLVLIIGAKNRCLDSLRRNAQLQSRILIRNASARKGTDFRKPPLQIRLEI